MALLRVIHASELPDPGDLLQRLASGAAAPARAPAGAAEAKPSEAPATFAALVELLDRSGKALIAQQLHDFAGVVRYAPPELVIRPSKPLASDFVRDLVAALKTLTGQAWQVRVADEPAEPTLLDQERAAADRLRDEVLASPTVAAAFEAFPEAELTGFTRNDGRSS
jgi:DNA polymerase-3 subunit gamma/tau